MTNKQTPYQQAVMMFGKEEVDRLSNLSIDPETGYISGHHIGRDYGLEERCVKCGGRAMWHAGVEFNKETALCLRCVDEWSNVSNRLLRKYEYTSSHKKWMQAFNEFLGMEPKKIDLEKHNATKKAEHEAIRLLYPQFFG